MTVWVWLAIGAVSFLGLSLLVGLVIASVLGRIARDASELLDAEPWASAPLTRGLESATEAQSEEIADREIQPSRQRQSRP